MAILRRDRPSVRSTPVETRTISEPAAANVTADSLEIDSAAESGNSPGLGGVSVPG